MTGRGYLAPYVDRAAATVMTALRYLEEVVKGHAVAPRDLHAAALGAFNLMGYSGASRMATAALDMAAWDALAQAQGAPLVTLSRRFRLACARLQQQRPGAYAA